MAGQASATVIEHEVRDALLRWVEENRDWICEGGDGDVDALVHSIAEIASQHVVAHGAQIDQRKDHVAPALN